MHKTDCSNNRVQPDRRAGCNVVAVRKSARLNPLCE